MLEAKFVTEHGTRMEHGRNNSGIILDSLKRFLDNILINNVKYPLVLLIKDLGNVCNLTVENFT